MYTVKLQNLRLITETSVLRGMKNFAIQTRIHIEGLRTSEARTREGLVLLYCDNIDFILADLLP